MKAIPNNMPHPNSWTRRPRTDCVVLHHAAARSYSAEQVNALHNSNGWNGIGYNYYIRNDGTIYEGRPLWAVGAHAVNWNSRSVGICCEGDFTIESMQPKQLAALHDCLLFVLDFYDLTPADVFYHKQVGSTDCPGANFPSVSEIVSYKPDKEVTEMEFNEWYDKVNPYYKTIDDVPEGWREDVRKMLDESYINGGTTDNKDDVNMRYETLQAVVVAYRMKA